MKSIRYIGLLSILGLSLLGCGGGGGGTDTPTYTISGTNTTGATVSIIGSSLTNTATNAATFSFNARSGETITLTATGVPSYDCTVSSFTNPISGPVSNLTVTCNSLATVTTLAGSGVAGDLDAIGIDASFRAPNGVAVDISGNIYVADTNNHLIRTITPTGEVSTLAGTGATGSLDGSANVAMFTTPRGVAIDTAGNIYVADTYNNKIRKITKADNVVSTLAGSGAAGITNSTTGTEASFRGPCGIAVDTLGNVYVADTGNHLIRKITPSGAVTTLAGTTLNGLGTPGSRDGNGSAALFNTPLGVAVDTAGNVYVADTNNFKIRKITIDGTVTTLAGSVTQAGTDGIGTSASFFLPTGIAVDGSGNIYVGDQSLNNDGTTRSSTIRKITPAGVVSTLAGSKVATGSTNGIGVAATFNAPFGVAVDSTGNIYVADTGNNKIRKITF